MSPVQLAPTIERSRHGCAAEKDADLPLHLGTKASLTMSTPTSRSLLLALSAQWHGDFPRSNLKDEKSSLQDNSSLRFSSYNAKLNN